MIAYRIGFPDYPLLDGAGAAASGNGRWSSRDRFVIYAAEHYSTALLEKAAQLQDIKLPHTLQYVRIEVPPEASVEEVNLADMPHWIDDRLASRTFGNRWYDEQRSLLLLVPSRVAPGIERNVLINQRHPEFATIPTPVPAPIVCHPNLII